MQTKLVRYKYDIDNPPPLTEEQKVRLARLAAMDDSSIDYSDIPEVTDFSRFVPFRDRHLYRPVKKSTTVRVDADVLQWLKAKGKGYQTRINAILREAMLKDAA
jgi:uncharacterized protein (DUF4415 family)